MGGQGKFVWHDLMAGDVEAAKRFYGELFGWRFERGKQDDYEHIFAGDQGIGGIVKVPPGQPIPPHWIGYATVDDLEAAVATVTRGGGRIHHREEVPGVGTFAVAADPQGAVFAPFYHPKSAGQPEGNERPAPHTFCWDELMTPEPDAAVKFYGAVFGWGAEHVDMPGFGRYTLFKRVGVKDEMGADQNAGGLMTLPPGVPHPFWLSYVAVPDADAAVARVKRLGGTTLSPPMDIPDVGRFATLMDPQRAAFAVLAPSA